MKILLISVLLVIIPSISSAVQTPYSAMVMDIKGTVIVSHGKESKNAGLGYILSNGDKVLIDRGASLTISYLESGQEERWSEGKEFNVGKTESSPKPATVKKIKISLPSKKFKQVGAFKVRAIKPPKITLKNLSNTQVIDQKPTFRWYPFTNTEKYRVSLFSEDNKLIWEKESDATELIYPSDEKPLEWGILYKWEIKAVTNDNHAAKNTSCFYLPYKKEVENITKQIEVFKRQQSDTPNNITIPLSLTFFLMQNQLYDDVLDQFREIQKLHGKSISISETENQIIKLTREDGCMVLDK